MSTWSNRVADLSSLAEASYVNFAKLKHNYTDDSVKAALADSDYDGRFMTTQAKRLVEGWTVVEHQANTSSGYSSTLFRSKNDPSEYVFAIRGTEQLFADGGADIGDIVFDGIALDQVVDMYNEWQRLKTPAGATYRAAYLETLPVETQAYQAARLGAGAEAYLAYLRSRTDLVTDDPIGLVRKISFQDSGVLFANDAARKTGSGALPTDASVSVTGHSLGGHLAAAFTRLFPELNASAVTFNGAGFPTGAVPGAGGNAASNISHVFKTLGGADTFPRDRIINLYGSVAPEL